MLFLQVSRKTALCEVGLLNSPESFKMTETIQGHPCVVMLHEQLKPETHWKSLAFYGDWWERWLVKAALLNIFIWIK